MSRVASVLLLLGTTRLFGVEATTCSTCILEYTAFCFGVLVEAKVPIRRGLADVVQPVMWCRSIPLST